MHVPFTFSTRDFEGATPKLGRVLGLSSESITKKISYDDFLENLGIHIMTELKGGECIVEIIKKMYPDVVGDFKTLHAPEELTVMKRRSHP